MTDNRVNDAPDDEERDLPSTPEEPDTTDDEGTPVENPSG